MKKQKTPSFVIIATLTVITIVSWVVYGVYQVFVTTPSLEIPPEVAAPLNPSLDTQSLDKLQKSVFFEDSEITKGIITISTPTPTVIPLTELTPSPTPEVTPEVTPEEQLTLTPTPTEITEEEL